MARRSWSHRALADDVDREVRQARDLVAARLTLADARPDLGQAAQADPARDRLAAGLVGAEAGQGRGQVHDAGVLVQDDDRAGADVGAGLRQGVVVEADTERLAGRMPPEGPPTSNGLEPARARDAAGHVQDLAERDAERDLGDAGAGDGPGDLDQDRAGEGSGVGFGEAGDAAGQDGRHGREGLRAVDEGWRADRGPGSWCRAVAARAGRACPRGP